MAAHNLRKPCQKCGAAMGEIRSRNGQDCVFCSGCGAWQYNAPRTETGRAVRSIQTVHGGIKPNQRARILLRANASCELCHHTDRPLHVGHMLSVRDGMSQGLTEHEINDDENLAAMCEECNLGLGGETVPARLLVAVLLARIRNRSHARCEAALFE